MKTIVCVDKAWGIGSANDLLYHIPDDMKFFREKTMNSVVVMGLATLKSFPGGNPLKNRVNIVLCDDPDFRKEGVILCGSIDELIQTLDDYDTDSVFIIGGASVYAQMLPYCDTAYVTKVDAVSPADKYFPNLDEIPGWECVCESEENEYEGLKFKFTKYTKTI
ncbi:MAG: dihydrofolate reductase [Clostridia bacterium]|nr:dihydrofolate reductase [Clostridia bacterium]